MKVLAISGSLRAKSTNTFLLKQALKLVPANVETFLFEGLADLPHFNPDLDTETPPEAVVKFRALLKSSDAILVCSPEYIHGVPGSLKNAFDWIASSGELDGMPVGIINASPSMDGASFAQASLKEILKVLSQNIVEGAVLSVTAVRTRMDAHGEITDSSLTESLGKAITSLIVAIK